MGQAYDRLPFLSLFTGETWKFVHQNDDEKENTSFTLYLLFKVEKNLNSAFPFSFFGQTQTQKTQASSYIIIFGIISFLDQRKVLYLTLSYPRYLSQCMNE